MTEHTDQVERVTLPKVYLITNITISYINTKSHDIRQKQNMRRTDQLSMKCLLPKTGHNAGRNQIIYGTRHHKDKPETHLCVILNEALNVVYALCFVTVRGK